MNGPRNIRPILDDGRTHKFWWTWIPAHPLSRDDSWYRVLEHVFGDQTINFISNGRWEGAYTEGSEAHQTLGILHSFSAFPTLHWVETLLDKCSIPFTSPVTQVRWQYHLRDNRAEADIALRVVDASGPESEFAVIFEAKRKGGRLTPKDTNPNYYLQIKPLSELTRKYLRFIVDKSDEARFAKVLSGDAVHTWQMIASVQLNELQRLIMPYAIKEYLVASMRSHLNWYFGTPALNTATLAQRLSSDDWGVLDPRIAALLRGLEIVLTARERLAVVPPVPWFEHEHTVDTYRDLKPKREWYTPVW